MREDQFITREELCRRLAAASIPPRAACEILARGLVTVRGRRHGNLTSERIEHLVRWDRTLLGAPAFFIYRSIAETDDGIFLDVSIDWPAIVSELRAAGFAVAGVQPDRARSQQRAAYAGPLAGWMAPKPLGVLQRMTPAAVAADFKLYCEQERPDLLPLLPNRLRSMEPLIERIVADRVAAVRADRAILRPPTARKGQ